MFFPEILHLLSNGAVRYGGLPEEVKSLSRNKEVRIGKETGHFPADVRIVHGVTGQHTEHGSDPDSKSPTSPDVARSLGAEPGADFAAYDPIAPPAEAEPPAGSLFATEAGIAGREAREFAG